MQHYWQKETIP